jgi:small subunit ribosomal protein S5
VLGCGSSQVMIRPALEGSGITAGGAVRAVLELAGYKNVNAKMLAGTNPLNNGRAALAALKAMRTPEQVAASRSLTTEEVRTWRALRRGAAPHARRVRPNAAASHAAPRRRVRCTQKRAQTLSRACARAPLGAMRRRAQLQPVS